MEALITRKAVQTLTLFISLLFLLAKRKSCINVYVGFSVTETTKKEIACEMP